MKKETTFLVGSLLLCTASFAQPDTTNDSWINMPVLSPNIVTQTEFSGRVGIGTQAPTAKLHITDIDPGEEALLIFRDQTAVGQSPYNPLLDISFDYQPASVVVNNPVFHIDKDGRIGMGTRSPVAELHLIKPTNQSFNLFNKYQFQIESENLGYTSFGVTANGVTHVGTPYSHTSVNQSTRALFEVWGTNNTALDMNTNFIASFRNWAGNGRVLRLKGGYEFSAVPIFQVESNSTNDNYDENVRFRILANGKVGIGDLNMDMDGDYRLYVQEGILAERLRVAVKNSFDWSDYVFSDDYQLMALDCVADYIEENNHLPGIPSAEQVVQSGVDVAKMDALLLSKIEELTLYMIQLEKENKKLASELMTIKESFNR